MSEVVADGFFALARSFGWAGAVVWVALLAGAAGAALSAVAFASLARGRA